MLTNKAWPGVLLEETNQWWSGLMWPNVELLLQTQIWLSWANSTAKEFHIF